MIEILQEITEWKDMPNMKNGIYHVNSAGNLVGYQSADGELRMYKVPMKQFSKARRKFKKIGEYREELPSDAIQVQGSNGKVYTILDGKCSCPGFKFRGNCKHIKEAV